MEKLKVICIASICCIVVGIICCGIAYVSPSSLQYESGKWYQIVHVDKQNQLNIQIKVAGLQISSTGDEVEDFSND